MHEKDLGFALKDLKVKNGNKAGLKVSSAGLKNGNI